MLTRKKEQKLIGGKDITESILNYGFSIELCNNRQPEYVDKHVEDLDHIGIKYQQRSLYVKVGIISVLYKILQ